MNLMGDLELTAGATLGAFIFLVVICMAVVFLFRNLFKKHSGGDLTEKYKDHEWSSPLEARAKYPEVNAFSWSRPIFLMGLAVAIAATLFAFSWTAERKFVNTDNNQTCLRKL